MKQDTTTQSGATPVEGEASAVIDAGSEDRTLDFADIPTPEEFRTPERRGETRSNALAVVPPSLDRERPERDRIVGRGVWIAGAVVLGGALVALVAWFAIANASVVLVPNVTGLPEGQAIARLEQAGLEARVAERRFSIRPDGEVLEQDPLSGTEWTSGETVSIVVSAGTEEFAMPDVVGDGIALARGTLEQRGLVLTIESVPSDATSDTVVATTPSAGTVVRTGDVVRVQVAAPLAGGRTLRPYLMDGLTVVIDPAPGPKGKADMTLEVSRRLQALLEASGARVVALRTGLSTNVSTAKRARAAIDATATAGVGLSVESKGRSGRSVKGDSVATPATAVASVFPRSVANQLATLAPPSVEASPTADRVFDDVEYPWARVGLGSFDDSADKTSFSDPKWADRVAEALYTALGEVFGTEDTQ